MDGVRAGERRGGRRPSREGRSPEPGRGRPRVHGVGEGAGLHPPAQPEHARLRRAGGAAPRGERRGARDRGLAAGGAPLRDRPRVPGDRLHQPGQAALLHAGRRRDQPRALRPGRRRRGPALLARALGPRRGGGALRPREDARPGGAGPPGGRRPGGGALRPARGRHARRPGLARARAEARALRRVEPRRPRRRRRVLARRGRVPGGADPGQAPAWRSSTASPGSRATTFPSTTGTGSAGSRSSPATTTRS